MFTKAGQTSGPNWLKFFEKSCKRTSASTVYSDIFNPCLGQSWDWKLGCFRHTSGSYIIHYPGVCILIYVICLILWVLGEMNIE